jgi:hypothetical protein
MESADVSGGKEAGSVLRDSLPLLSAGAASVAVLCAVVFQGQSEAARGDRVLGTLDFLAFRFRERAALVLGWSYAHRSLLALFATLFLAATAAAVCARGGRRGLPAALLSAAAVAGVWAEVLLLKDAHLGGWALFAAAVLAAAVAARMQPLALTPGFPAWPDESAPRPSTGRALPGWTESLGLFAVFLLALFTRAWAVNQLPSTFDEEMISVQTQSRTAHGLRQFIATEFVGTSNGLATPATNRLVFATLGVSLYATRVTALVWGLAAVPLFWSLVRRLCGGALATFGATLLFVCAPEQLFWSRSEVSVFAPVAALGLLFAHAGLSMVGRFGIAPVLLAAAVTPLCRLFYTAGHVLFVYPAFLAGHAALFAKGVARRALGALPVLLLGIAVWVASVSIAVAAAGGPRRFVDPAQVRGEPAWRAGFPSTASYAEILRGQAARVAGNLASVGAGLTSHQAYASHWYERFAVVPKRDPMVCVGLTILAAVGLGYLLGQIAERRAALVLFWLGLGLLPGVLSDEPDARRLSLIFVPIILLAAFAVTAWVRLARDAGGRLVGHLASAGAGLAFAGVAAAGLASNLLLPVAPMVRDEQIRFARPLVESSDIILHNLFYRFGKTLEFGVLDRLLSPAGPCMQFVDRGDELLSMLRPSCDFREEVYGLTLSPVEIASRRRAFHAARVSYLFHDTPPARQAVSILPAVDPGARVLEHDWPSLGERLLAFEVNPEALRAATAPEESPGGVRGGFVVPKPGWYRLALDPPCPLARIAVGASRWNGEEERPLLPGIFPFEISGPAGCVSRARPVLTTSGTTGRFAPALTAPSLALLPETRGVEPVSFAGWPRGREVLRTSDRISDFGVDRDGRLYVLFLHDQSWEVRRYSRNGVETARVRAELPLDASTGTLLVEPQGGCVAFSLRAFERFDENLARKGRWELPDGLSGSHVARFSDGHLAVLAGSLLHILGANGRVESVWGPEGEAGGRFQLPIAVAFEGDRLAVIEGAGGVHVFRLAENPIALRPESRFMLAFAREPHPEYLRGAAFDGPRLLVPYSPDEAPLIVDAHGTRLMPARSSSDLRRGDLASPYRFARVSHELFVLDGAVSAIHGLTPGEAP